MIYKNGAKDYILTMLLIVIPMGISLGIIFDNLKRNILSGVISGILCGLLFTLLIYLLVKFLEKKYDKMRLEIAQGRKVICDGAASLQGVDGETMPGIGGWMFFTEKGLEFYPHKLNILRVEMMIPINDIKSVITNKNQIIVDTIDNSKFIIAVSHNKEWMKQIQSLY